MNNFLKVFTLLIFVGLLVFGLFIFDKDEVEVDLEPKNKELSETEIDYIVQVIMTWIERESNGYTRL